MNINTSVHSITNIEIDTHDTSNGSGPYKVIDIVLTADDGSCYTVTAFADIDTTITIN